MLKPSNKIRLVGGPFGGKVMNSPDYGRNEIIIRGPKKMSRKAKFDYLRDNYVDALMYPVKSSDGSMLLPGARFPVVEARYRISVHPHVTPSRNVFADMNIEMRQLPCMHPDGSIFYEYIEGTKTEYR